MDIPAILTANYPNNTWSLNGDEYTGLVWDDSNTDPKPTKKALEAAWPQVKYDREYKAVEKARQAAYIETSDPLFFEWQRGDATEQQWRDAVQAVKTAHPYPTPPGE
jgi:hypothetical protein